MCICHWGKFVLLERNAKMGMERWKIEIKNSKKILKFKNKRGFCLEWTWRKMGLFLGSVGDDVGSESPKFRCFCWAEVFGLLGVIFRGSRKILNQTYLDCAWCGEERSMSLILLCVCFVWKVGRFLLSGDVIIFSNFFWKKKGDFFPPEIKKFWWVDQNEFHYVLVVG